MLGEVIVTSRAARVAVSACGRSARTARSITSCQVLRAEGGWSAVLRIPHTMPEDERVIRLLEDDHVLVHPGYFFDFPRDGYLVVSLLTRPDTFRAALDRLLAAVVRG